MSRLEAILFDQLIGCQYMTEERIDDWISVANDILKLPIPEWDDPGAVSGTIEEAK